MKKICNIIVFLYFIGGLSLMGANSKVKRDILENLLPRKINGWEAKEKDELYNPQTIFDYINGAGEVYRSYNFRLLLARRFSKSGQPDIVADLFEMASSKDAFGVFTHDLEGEEAGVGRGSTYKGGLLSFWKGRFFVSLYAEEETKDAKEALFALGEKAASSIEDIGEEPDIISFLPEEALVEKSVHYFHNHMILNYHYYVSDENILLLDQETEAAIATYREENERAYLLVVRYPDPSKASQAFQNFLKIYMPDAKEMGLVKTEDGKWTAARFKEDILVVLFNGTSANYAKGMLEHVLKKTA